MPPSHSTSFAISAAISVSIVAAELMFKSFLSSTQPLTVVTGFINSLLFVFLVTAVSNLEMMQFGPSFQTKLAEVILCLLFACTTAGLVHRVSVTTCFIFSLIALYRLTRATSSSSGGTGGWSLTSGSSSGTGSAAAAGKKTDTKKKR